MSKKTLDYATIKNIQTIKMDGASIERVIGSQEVWLSDKFALSIMAVLLFVGLIKRTLNGIARDLAATVNHHKTNLKHAPEWITVYFLSNIWGLILWPEK